MYLVAALALAAAPCFASTIAVTNFSFETLPAGGLTTCGAGCAYDVGAIPGWSTTSGATSGQIQPNATQFPVLSDGITSAFSTTAGSVISQTVGATVVMGEVYTLLIDLGQRLDGYGFAGTADLLINGHTYAATGTAPVPGTWSTYTATYTGLTADVGQSITIELKSSGVQANFDNVRMDGTLGQSGVPEPASFLLIGPALVALGLRMKRTARS
jgi:hypothetical protein